MRKKREEVTKVKLVPNRFWIAVYSEMSQYHAYATVEELVRNVITDDDDEKPNVVLEVEVVRTGQVKTVFEPEPVAKKKK